MASFVTPFFMKSIQQWKGEKKAAVSGVDYKSLLNSTAVISNSLAGEAKNNTMPIETATRFS